METLSETVRVIGYVSRDKGQCLVWRSPHSPSRGEVAGALARHRGASEKEVTIETDV